MWLNIITRQARFARFEHNGFVERFGLPAAALADKNSQQHGVVREVHTSVLWLDWDDWQQAQRHNGERFRRLRCLHRLICSWA
jgi:hypothetical protein